MGVVKHANNPGTFLATCAKLVCHDHVTDFRLRFDSA